MAYFPLFIELKNKKILLIGGGAVALRKVTKLLPYGPSLTVIAPEICDALSALSEPCREAALPGEISGAGCSSRPTLRLIRRTCCDTDLDEADLVITATNDRALNAHISDLCRARRIPVNAVDDAELCTFLFPSLVKRGDLSIGISTGGASPTAAIYTRETIDRALPDCMEDIIAFLAAVRPRILAEFPDSRVRPQLFRALFMLCLQKESALTEEELNDFLKRQDACQT